ncbi:MAG: gliding motility-associated C-terminal domain-containing protein [Bacteroidota bacterium]|nr:gliding motility-associated C-terminal domain-containing protein [Bacteroidota bacterium]
MIKSSKKLICFLTTLFSLTSYYSQNVNVIVRVPGLRHNYDCGNDGASGNQPDPRWRLWGGHSGANYIQYTGVVANCGDGQTIARDEVSCGLINNFTAFNVVSISNSTATVVNVDMECWEEDGCGNDCNPDNCGFPTFNSDDVQNGRAVIANINFKTYPPCTFTNIGTYFRDATNGYGADLEVYWEYVSILPGSVAGSQTICTGATPSTFTNATSATTFAVYQWQSSPDNVIWTDVPGATLSTYNPPALTVTTYYRRKASTCTAPVVFTNTLSVLVNPVSTTPTLVTASSTSICNTSTVNLSVAGGTLQSGGNWTWYAGGCATGAAIGTGTAITVNTSSTTTYYVRGEGSCGNSSCNNVIVNLLSPSTDPVAAIATSTIICPSGNTNLSVSGGSLGTGAQWVWYSGSCGSVNTGSGTTILVSPSVTTTYFVRAEGACGNGLCKSVTVNLGAVSIAASSASVMNNFVCPGDSAKLYLTGGTLALGNTWVWYTGGCGAVPVGVGDTLKVTPSGTTIYYVRAVGDCGNTTCKSVQVNVNQASVKPTAIVSTANNFCSGVTATLSIVGGSLTSGANWAWYEGQCGTGTPVATGNTLVVTPTVNTTYFVKSQGGTCPNSDCVNLPLNVLTTYAYMIPMDTICGIGQPFPLNIGIPPGGNYSGLGVVNNVFYPSIAGVGSHNITYSYTSNGCSAVTSSSISLKNSNINAAYTINERSCAEGGIIIDVKVSGGTGLYNYFWSNGESTPKINYAKPGTYSVTIIDGKSCAATINDINVSNDLGCLNIPNAFTPNGDGVNDVWNVNLSSFSNPSLQIYSKWGQLIYDKDSPTHAWDGKWNGSDLPPGTYYYVIKYNSDKTQTGPVTLVR